MDLMKPNNIIFADLSTYTPTHTMAFYESVFGWKYYRDQDYYLAYKRDRVVVGLYETPEKFKQIKMPHFWMTYIEVESIQETVAKAKALGGIIEMVQEMNSFGKVALIRDPQGAGFTIYEGSNLANTRTKNEINTMVWNELHVSDAAAIIPFYQGIFQWNIKPTGNDTFKIYNGRNEYISDVLQLPNAVKGKYEYWVCTFAVEEMEMTKSKILDHGGSIVIDEGSRIMFADNSGQSFFYIKEV